MKPHVALIFTGGTISMHVEPASGGAVPVLSGQEILDRAPGLSTLTEWQVIDFGQWPGPHMTPRRMWELAQLIRAQAADPRVTAVVVTHGTDTLEETAFLFSLLLHERKPIVLVGALRPSSHPLYDGPANLDTALRVAIAPDAAGLGILVAMGDRVWAGSDVVKTHTESAETFQSRDGGPLGYVDGGRVYFTRRPVPGPSYPIAELETRVELVKLSAGSDGILIESLIDRGYRGIVIEGLGRGNVPPEALPAIHRAVAAGVVVVITTRCTHGRVLDTYGYDGGGRTLRAAGVLLGGNLPGPKARLKLMAMLGAQLSLSAIRDAFEQA